MRRFFMGDLPFSTLPRVETTEVVTRRTNEWLSRYLY